MHLNSPREIRKPADQKRILSVTSNELRPAKWQVLIGSQLLR